MNANIMTSKIEMTKTEAIAAGRLNSDKFNDWTGGYPNETLCANSTKRHLSACGGFYMRLSAALQNRLMCQMCVLSVLVFCRVMAIDKLQICAYDKAQHKGV